MNSPQQENQETSPQEILAGRVLEILLKHSNTIPLESPPESSSQSANHWRYNQILARVKEGSPLRFVILGFPAKARNPYKTLSSLPDRGEVEGLKLLEGICREIESIYSPGAKVTVCSDGHVFANLVGVTDEGVNEYQKEIIKIIHDFQFSHVGTFSMSETFSGTYDEMRKKLIREFGEEIDVLRNRTSCESEALELFNGIHRFLFEDTLAIETKLSRSQIRKETKQRAYQVIQHSNAFSKLVEKELPGAIRLSIHPQRETSKKLGIKLVPGKDRWGTPWHNVLLETSRGIELVPKFQAEKLGATLRLLAGKYAYFFLEEDVAC